MKPSALPEDYDLIVAIQAGDAAAFQTLYRKYWRPLFNVSYQATRHTDDAKDLVQELFADIWQNRAAVKPDTFSAAYLHATLRHKLLDRIRKQAVRQQYISRIVATTTDHDNSTEAALQSDAFLEHLQRELIKLPERCRLIFQLSRFDDLSVDEIAGQLRLSPQTVKNQLTKALFRLRTSLHEYATWAGILVMGYWW
ncbi:MULTISPECIES: RNA polymerase sigma factor [Spirosoma]|nr:MULTISPECIES: RNA polymerase sigma-70 factor [Spirosoma]